MAELVFEIWRDEREGRQSMALVSPQNDKVRRETMPDAVCVHRYKAESTFDAFRQNNALNGWGPWNEPEMEDRIFTDEEAAIQRDYLDRRTFSVGG